MFLSISFYLLTSLSLSLSIYLCLHSWPMYLLMYLPSVILLIGNSMLFNAACFLLTVSKIFFLSVHTHDRKSLINSRASYPNRINSFKVFFLRKWLLFFCDCQIHYITIFRKKYQLVLMEKNSNKKQKTKRNKNKNKKKKKHRPTRSSLKILYSVITIFSAGPRCVMVKVPACGIAESEFEYLSLSD